MEKNIKVSAIATCYKNGYKFFPEFFKCAVNQTIRDQLEVVLVHYNPSEEERKMVADFQAQYPGLLNYVEGPQENVASAMNRAIYNSHGEYCAIWNIDDLRTENSFELEMKALDAHPEAAYTYGDIIMVNAWLKKTGREVSYPEFNKRDFIRHMNQGPYYMWRKSVHEKIGYFDEQFNSATDYDFSARLSVEFEGVKTHGLLGYYLDIGGGISTGKGALAKIEKTVVELRYGSFRKIDFWYLSRAKKYRIEEIKKGDAWTSVSKLVPHRTQYMDGAVGWAVAVVTYPFWIVERLGHKLRRMYYQKFA